MTQIDPQIEEILRRGRCEGNLYYLPPEQLDTKTYQSVNAVLAALGGKWKGGKVKAHVFDEDCAVLLARVFETGEQPISAQKAAAFFATPPEVAETVALRTSPSSGWLPLNARVLEPSAGHGALIDAFLKQFISGQVQVDAVELLPQNVKVLRKKYADDSRVHVYEADVLQWQAEPYDLIICNPPFSVEGDSSAYVTHLNHYWSLLKPGGRLVGIVPAGLRFRNDKKIKALRELVEANGLIEDLEDGAFDDSGTGARTCLVVMDKPSAVALAPPAPKAVATGSDDLLRALGVSDETVARMHDMEQRLVEPTEADVLAAAESVDLAVADDYMIPPEPELLNGVVVPRPSVREQDGDIYVLRASRVKRGTEWLELPLGQARVARARFLLWNSYYLRAYHAGKLSYMQKDAVRRLYWQGQEPPPDPERWLVDAEIRYGIRQKLRPSELTA